MGRKELQAQLLYELGLLISPIQHIVDNPQSYNEQTRSRAGARFFHDQANLLAKVFDFTKSEEGYLYAREQSSILQLWDNLRGRVKDHLDDHVKLGECINKYVPAIRHELLRIPVEPDALVLQPNTPFTSFNILRDVFECCSRSIIMIDRYLDSGVFYRYLRHVDPNVSCTLVTWSQQKYVSTGSNWNELMDISRLFANERGATMYKLVANENIHDRWLYVDNQIYSVSGSIKDAGKKAEIVITPIASSTQIASSISNAIHTGVELFGSNHPQHP